MGHACSRKSTQQLSTSDAHEKNGTAAKNNEPPRQPAARPDALNSPTLSHPHQPAENLLSDSEKNKPDTTFNNGDKLEANGAKNIEMDTGDVYCGSTEGQRGPSASSSSSVRRRAAEDRTIVALSDDRARDVLRLTWSDDFDALYILGTDIYAEIFRLKPETKALFRDLDGYDLIKNPEALRECRAFGKQALRFVQVLSIVVQNCTTLNQVDEHLRDIGRRHIQHKSKGFQADMWLVFETAIDNVMERRAEVDERLDDDSKRVFVVAWRELARHIIATMTLGFLEE